MMHHVRPWEIFKKIEGKEHDVLLTIPSVRGTESLTIMSIETILLVAMARIVDAKKILEIGTSMGHTSLHLAMNTDADIWTIDMLRKPCVFEGTVWERKIRRITEDVLDVRSFDVDMVFCDCNYSKELTMGSTEFAFECQPKVVAWHDYGNEKDAPHQKETLDRVAEYQDIYHIEDTWLCCWFREGL